MRFSVRRLHVCAGKEKRTLRKGAFCAGTLTEKRILDQRRHEKAHFGRDLSFDAIRPSRKSAPCAPRSPRHRAAPCAPRSPRHRAAPCAPRSPRHRAAPCGSPHYAPSPCALLGMHCDLGDDASDPPRSRYSTPAGYTNHHETRWYTVSTFGPARSYYV